MSLDRRGRLLRRQATQWRALAKLLPQTDVFHFYFGLTLVPKSVQFPILRRAREEVRLPLPRLGHPRQDTRRARVRQDADAEIVGRYDAIRWVPEADVIPPGIDLAASRPRRPRTARGPSSSTRRRPRAERDRARDRGGRGARRRSRDRRGPAPRRGLRALPRGRHRRRPAERRLVRPLRDRVHGARQARRHVPPRGGACAARRRRSACRCRSSPRRGDAARAAAAARRRRRRASPHGGGLAGLRGARARSERITDRLLESTLGSDMALSGQLKRLGKHSAIYGLGGLVSRILAVLLLPLYTHYLSPSDYGQIETLIRSSRCSRSSSGSASQRLLPLLLRPEDDVGRRLVLRTSFWFTMSMATLGLVVVTALASPIAQWLSATRRGESRRGRAPSALWAQMNYEQLTSLFRVEERSVAFVIASLDERPRSPSAPRSCSSSCWTRVLSASWSATSPGR